jgi:hypothetical protein
MADADDFENLLGKSDDKAGATDKVDDDALDNEIEMEDLTSEVPDLIADEIAPIELAKDEDADEAEEEGGDEGDDDESDDDSLEDPDDDNEGDDDDAVDDDGDPDLADIKNKSIRDRIMRERRKAGEARDAAEAQAKEFRNNALIQNEQSHRKRVKDTYNLAKNAATAADLVIEARKEAWKAAREEGNTDKEIAAQGDIQRWEKIKEQNGQIMVSARNEWGKIDEWKKTWNPDAPALNPATREADAAQEGDAAGEVPKLAVEWVNANPWFIDKANLAIRNYAEGVEVQLIEGGYSQDDPKLYQLLAQRVAKRFPEIKVMNTKGKRVAGTTTRKVASPTGGGEEGTSGRPAATGGGKSGDKGQVDAIEKAKMRQFGMNPNEPTHVKEWRANHPRPKSKSSRRARVA